MPLRHEIWVHGLQVHVQNEPDPIATSDQLDDDLPNPRLNSQGTRIRQHTGSNWVHVAFPTPLALDPTHRDLDLWICAVLIKGKANGQVYFEQLHMWGGGAPDGRKLDAHAYGGNGIRLNGDIDLVHEYSTYIQWTAPLAIDMLLTFDDRGDITIGSVGVRFFTPSILPDGRLEELPW